MVQPQLPSHSSSGGPEGAPYSLALPTTLNNQLSRVMQQAHIQGPIFSPADFKSIGRAQQEAQHILNTIAEELRKEGKPKIKLVLLNDTTGSMNGHLGEVRKNIPGFLRGIFSAVLHSAHPNIQQLLEGIEVEITNVEFGDGNFIGGQSATQSHPNETRERIDEPYMYARKQTIPLSLNPKKLEEDLSQFDHIFDDPHRTKGGSNWGESCLEAFALLPPAKDTMTRKEQLNLLQIIFKDLMPLLQKELSTPGAKDTLDYITQLVKDLAGQATMAAVRPSPNAPQPEKDISPDVHVLLLITDDIVGGPLIKENNEQYMLLRNILQGMDIGYAATITPKEERLMREWYKIENTTLVQYWTKIWDDLFGQNTSKQNIDLDNAEAFNPEVASRRLNSIINGVAERIGNTVVGTVTDKVTRVVEKQLALNARN